MMRTARLVAACMLVAGQAGTVAAKETTVPIFRPRVMPKPPISHPMPQPTAPKPAADGN